MSGAARGAGVPPARRRPTVLLVTFSPDYPAPARMPRELQRAGIEVILLAPPGALCTKTRFVDRLQHMPEEQSILEWIDALVELVHATGARLLLPGDDVTVQVFMQIMHEPLPALRPGVQAGLAALIRTSLGDPAGYLDSIHKGRLARRAQRLGLPVPPGESVADAETAVRVAAVLGYPVMVRPTFGWASRGFASARMLPTCGPRWRICRNWPRGFRPVRTEPWYSA